MLAQLESLPGIDEARVDWTGAHILLRLDPTAEPGAVESRLAAALGTDPRRLDPAAEADKVASFRRGEAWMRSRETLRLSEEEARVLGARTATSVAAELDLAGAKVDALRELFREEIFRSFERIHDAEGSLQERLQRDGPVALERIGEGCRRFLTEEESERVVDALRRRYGVAR